MDKECAVKGNYASLQDVVGFVCFRAGVDNGACGFVWGWVLVGRVKPVGPLLVVFGLDCRVLCYWWCLRFHAGARELCRWCLRFHAEWVLVGWVKPVALLLVVLVGWL